MLAGLSVAVLSFYSMSGPFWALSTSSLNTATAGAGIALINAVGNLGGFLGPHILGAARDSKSGLLGLSAVIAASGVLLLAIRGNSLSRG
jgi:hypothetical protein